MKNILLKVISVVGLFFSAVFYVLFIQKKDENKKLRLLQEKELLKDLQKQHELELKLYQNNIKARKGNETEIKNIISSTGNDFVDNANTIMQKLSQRRTNKDSNSI